MKLTSKTIQTQQSQIKMAPNQVNPKSKPRVLCLKGKQALNVCSNKLCDKYAFVCSDKSCQCRKFHESCLKTQIQSLLRNITQKSWIKQVENKIEQIFTKIRTDIEQFKDRLLLQLYESEKNQNLSEIERNLVCLFQNEQFDKIYGKLIWEVQTLIFIEKSEQIIVENAFNSIDVHTHYFDRKLKQFFLSISNCLSSLNTKESKSFQNSQLIKSEDQVTTILNFFDSQIYSTTLLYRASENQFLLEKFYEKCSLIKNTLTICETQHNKVVGGFTGLEWFKTQKCQQVPDESGLSFLFSLTNKDKFVLKNKMYAINRSSSSLYGPAFGNGWDFFIKDKANQNNSSGSRINTSYWNENYNSQQKQSVFLGTAKGIGNCKLKEWEVWKIQFLPHTLKAH